MKTDASTAFRPLLPTTLIWSNESFWFSVDIEPTYVDPGSLKSFLAGQKLARPIFVNEQDHNTSTNSTLPSNELASSQQLKAEESDRYYLLFVDTGKKCHLLDFCVQTLQQQ